jgi:hypothetical protein
MSEQKPSGHSGQGAAPQPDERQSGDSPKPHGDKLEHAVKEAAARKPGKTRH